MNEDFLEEFVFDLQHQCYSGRKNEAYELADIIICACYQFEMGVIIAERSYEERHRKYDIIKKIVLFMDSLNNLDYPNEPERIKKILNELLFELDDVDYLEQDYEDDYDEFITDLVEYVSGTIHLKNEYPKYDVEFHEIIILILKEFTDDYHRALKEYQLIKMFKK